jgi:hypothetical protein
MKFTVDRAALVKMLQSVAKKAPAQKRRDKNVRLSACAARVFVEANQTTAGVEALVFVDGTCFLHLDVFLKLLKTYAPKPNITIEADRNAIKFFSTTLSLTGYSRTVTPPGKFHVFPVTDLTVLLPQTAIPPPPQPPAPPPPPAPEPPPVVPHEPGTLPMADEDMALAEQLVRLTRRLCALPQITPQHLVGLAHALFAFDRLPLVTVGVDLAPVYELA